VLSPRLSSYWLGLVTAVPASIARALIGGLKHDLPADSAELQRLVPQRLLTFRESVQEALKAEMDNAVAARWTEGVMMYRAYKHENAFYAKKAGASAETTASADAVWRVVTSIGGANGYYYWDALWTLREILDWLAGGAGLTRGRRSPTELRLGDNIDYWTVIGIEPPERLTLSFGLKAPGSGVLEFLIEKLPGGNTRLTETAYWHPQGVWGLLYWAVLAPFHIVIFKGMTREIARRAEALPIEAEPSAE
jgi:hypothetical protein